MASRRRTVLQTKFFYAASVFACTFGVVSFLWHHAIVNWFFVAFGLIWVGIVTLFAWDVMTRTENLDREVRARTKELQDHARRLAETNRELKELDAMKSEFVANVSHELRTPLTSIRAFSEILERGGLADEERLEFAGIIRDESDRLASLIDAILNAERIRNGTVKWNVEPVSPEDLIGHVVRLFRHQAERDGLSLQGQAKEGLPDVKADRDRTLTVLNNLVSNALKFTPEGGEVSVGAEAEDGGEAVRFSVSDTGVGISPEERERVFEPFSVGGDETTAGRGTGLGLNISKQIVEQLGGRIWVEDRPEAGSTFYFTLPVAGRA